ncbi:TRM11 family SAM-dependent methyltransferase [Micromonospora krabiensis]|uniref:Methyltransferase n=1 Tax=Micromonospora krabiensis TaxID=307121 RepID=A0A1C3MWL8_9ACTN|nr:DNA methyltransferase [Micromonospora krabiensis]SBV24728.1 Methyltransferase domain-containing protein [Micromonospora krabiensis]
MAEPLSVTSVWLTCQQPARDQRRGRYVPQTSTHPGKMLPHLAAHAISSYTAPGELVLDPMCGSGTTLVEAMHLGRHAIGVDVEPRFTALAEANVALAASQGAAGTAAVLTGDATGLLDLMPASAVGQVSLVLTSPPYGRATHGLVQMTKAGVRKRNHVYGDRERGNLAYGGWSRLLDGFAQILAASYQLLRPGGTAVITCRPVRRQRDDLLDLPGELLAVARSVGLVPVQRCAAMLAAVRDGQIVHRANMFGLLAVRRSRHDGIPVHLVAHEDVLVLRRC